ncbi:MAG: ferredoxin-thioredoxin reductase variable chain [Cyanobacteria bacterium P01_F01_bin.42]
MKAGDRVKVQASVIVYHYPKYRNRPFDIRGLEGEVVAVQTGGVDRSVSAGYPLQVKFNQRFRAHLAQSEVEAA